MTRKKQTGRHLMDVYVCDGKKVWKGYSAPGCGKVHHVEVRFCEESLRFFTKVAGCVAAETNGTDLTAVVDQTVTALTAADTASFETFLVVQFTRDDVLLDPLNQGITVRTAQEGRSAGVAVHRYYSPQGGWGPIEAGPLARGPVDRKWASPYWAMVIPEGDDATADKVEAIRSALVGGRDRVRDMLELTFLGGPEAVRRLDVDALLAAFRRPTEKEETPCPKKPPRRP